MTTAIAVTAAFISAVWAASHVLTVLAEQTPPPRQYLAGRCDNLIIADLVVYHEELLVTFAPDPTIGLTTRIWWVANDPSPRHRLERWRNAATTLRADLSTDGAIMLADPVWGRNVAREPAMAVT